MFTMKNVRLLCLLLVLLYSCNSNKQRFNDNTFTIDFKLEQNSMCSDILETVFLKLETNEDCFIDKTIVQLEFASDKLFVLTGGVRDIFVFDLSGRFIARIGAKGRGPGEYIVPMSFSIDYQRDVISVVDMGQQKIVNYDLNDFSFVSEWKINYDSSCFEYLGENKLIWRNMNYLSSYPEWGFIITDMDQNFLDKAVEKKVLTGYSTGRLKTMYKKDNVVFVYSQYDSQIYCLQNDGISPIYNLTFKDHSFPPIEYLQKISADNNADFIPELIASNYIYSHTIFDVDQTFCVSYSVAQTPYIGIYDKEANRSYNYNLTTFQDDLQLGRIDQISGVTDKYIVAILMPFDLLNKKAEGYEFSRDLQPLVTESLPDDNPILCLFKIETN